MNVNTEIKLKKKDNYINAHFPCLYKYTPEEMKVNFIKYSAYLH